MPERTAGFAKLGRTWPVRHDTRTLPAIENRMVDVIRDVRPGLFTVVSSLEARAIVERIMREFWVIPK